MEPFLIKQAALDEKYEFYNYLHAYEILTDAFTGEWMEMLDMLKGFSMHKEDITAGGGNESKIPKIIDSYLYPYGWREIRIEGDLHIKEYIRQTRQREKTMKDVPYEEKILQRWIDGHNIDFVKGRVAFDLEWNSKDQTFDRDLMAMKTYFDCGIIDVGIIMTRSADLNPMFSELGLKAKYGASTTWMGKLTYRLDARRSGGCPILAIGIKRGCVID